MQRFEVHAGVARGEAETFDERIEIGLARHAGQRAHGGIDNIDHLRVAAMEQGGDLSPRGIMRVQMDRDARSPAASVAPASGRRTA